MSIHKFSLFCFAAWLGASAYAATGELLVPATAAMRERGSNVLPLPTGHHALSFNPAAFAMQPGEEIRLSLPNQTGRQVIFDRKVAHANGDQTWIGHITDNAANDHRVIITRGKGFVTGQIRTAGGKFRLHTEGSEERLIDMAASGAKAAPFDQHPLLPPAQSRSRTVAQAREASAAIAAAGASTIDLLLLYSDGMVKRYGSDANVLTRLNHLVAVANQAYADSNIAITLRLVRAQKTSYVDNTNLTDALYALSASENSWLQYAADPALASTLTLRNTYGADVVSMVRPYDRISHQRTCGLAWLGGQNGTNISQDVTYAYSVIGDGDDINGSNSYCDDFTLAHELGHNMGSAHDVANAGSQGAYPYSYGYGSAGIFGTIMSYIDPTVGKFSSPLLTCNGMLCGVANQADNARSLNNAHASIASYRASKTNSNSLQPQSGWWWNASEPGRGFFFEMTGGKVFMADFLYANSGIPLWYVTSASYTAFGAFAGNLNYYSGGQTLTGSYKLPNAPVSHGAITVSFSDETHGTMVWPGGNVPLTRFEISPGSLAAPAPAFQPETGWWWNANESGRGFAIEIQGNYLFIAGFMYDVAGNPAWYFSTGAMTSNSLYQGQWVQCQGGQPMVGVFRQNACSALANGSLSLSFTSRTTGILVLPDSRQVSLTRFPLP